jgi:hypothetical protein
VLSQPLLRQPGAADTMYSVVRLNAGPEKEKRF